MYLEMHGVGCAECGRPVTAWTDRIMRPCGCPALGGPPSSGGGPARVLRLPSAGAAVRPRPLAVPA